MSAENHSLTRRQLQLLVAIGTLAHGALYTALEGDPDIRVLVQNEFVTFEPTRRGVGTARLTLAGRSAAYHRVLGQRRVNRRLLPKAD